VGRGGRNLSMINISTLSQFPEGDMGMDDSSLPEAPSYDPPNYEGLFTSNTNERSSGESSGTDAVETTDAGANTTATSTAGTGEVRATTSGSNSTSTSSEDGKETN
jgi:hypothetical protein